MIYSVVIPMYNEKAIAESCVSELSDKLEEAALAFSFEYEIIVSDDGSTDGSGDIVRDYAAKNPLDHGKIRVITADRNRGKGSAVRLGMLEAAGDYILFTDSDLAYGVDSCVDMLRQISDTKGDVLIGSRARHKEGYAGYTFIRKLASKVYMSLLAVSAGFSYSDSQCGIKVFKKSAAHKVFSMCEVDGWAFDFEALLIAEKAGFKIEEYPVKIINHRESKIRLVRDSLKMMRDISHIKKRISKLSI
ncbi:MAG: glycosyltransferase [Ruminococcaceae bacterium]|nr:glycosyltransferase [Oscillospiraceae bacterium]